MKTTMIMGVAMMVAATSLAPETASAQQTTSTQQTGTAQPGTRRTPLQQADLSAPGRQLIQVRVDFDPGYTSPWHTHPGEEIIYVIEGTIEYQVQGQPTKTYKPGEVLIVPYGTPHIAKNVGTTNAAELATYVVEKGKPLITLVKEPGTSGQ
jgi:quercetin dioxygenase-like cupin family protein